MFKFKKILAICIVMLLFIGSIPMKAFAYDNESKANIMEAPMITFISAKLAPEGANLTFESNQNGNYYCLIKETNTDKPDPLTVKAQGDAIAKASGQVVTGTAITIFVEAKLDENKQYTAYLVAENEMEILSEVESMLLTDEVMMLMDTAMEKDDEPPVPGDLGKIDIQSNYTHEPRIRLTWTKATDDISAQNNLKYYVYRSNSDNIRTIEECETNGILQNVGGSKDIDSFSPGWMDYTNIYYYNVIVVDSAGNKAIYEPVLRNGIVFTKQPKGLTLAMGYSDTLSVSAFSDPEDTVSYQWYYNTVDTYNGAYELHGNTEANYIIPSTQNLGYHYFFCKASIKGGSIWAYSNRVTVKIMSTSDAPRITGQTAMTLVEGYSDTFTDAYTITGTSPITVVKKSGHEKITWDNEAKKLKIAAGLPVGTYTVILEATNPSASTDTLTLDIKVKMLQTPPSKPELNNKTAVSVTLKNIAGAKYRIGSDGMWQDSPTFTGLTPNTSYTFYAVYPETETHAESHVSEGLTVTTDKPILSGEVSINGTAKFGETLTVQLSDLIVTPTGEEKGTLSFSWMHSDTGVVIGTGSTYTITEEDIGKTITVTVTATNCDGSVTSSPVMVEKADGPLITSITGSLSGNGARIKETKTHKAGPYTSTGTVTFTKLDNTQVPVLEYTVSGSNYNQTITIKPIDNGEYKFGDDPWSDTSSKGGYVGGQTVTIQARYKETGTHNPSVANSIIVNIPKSIPEQGGSGESSNSDGWYYDTTEKVLPEKKPNQPVTVVASFEAKAGKNGSASATIPDKVITDAITKALNDSKTQDKTQDGIAIELKATMPQGSTSLTVTLSHNSIKSLVKAGVISLRITGSPVYIRLDLKVLQEIQNQSSGDITISITPVKKLSKSAKAIIGTRPVYDITIRTIKRGKTVKISTFNGGTATISIPYVPGDKEVVGFLYGVYVDENGGATGVDSSVYNANTGEILISTGHLSVYGVGYNEPANNFTDIKKHWAKEEIDYVVSRGLVTGTSKSTFKPNDPMTRGELVTALGRLSGVDMSGYKTSSFTDVKVGSDVHPYIEWAYKAKMIQGVGNGKFAPERAITREEFVLILYNYAKATEYVLPVTRFEVTYDDHSKIGSVYKEAVKAMQQAGILMGDSNNRLNPGSITTRAEASAMLTRYIKLTIDPDTTLGWVKNDVGQWMYYDEGKAITGWMDIEVYGNTNRYYFSTYGVMIAGKWFQINGKWYYFYQDGTLARNTNVDGYKVDENGVRMTKTAS